MEKERILESSFEDHDGSHYGTVHGLDAPVDDTPTSACARLWRKMFPHGYCGEFKELFSLAWPMILTQLSQFFIPIMALMFCGHLGKEELDAVALANSMINVTGLSVALGLSAACDTLFSQIFGGPNKSSLGTALQRSILILMLAAFPCLAIHLNTEALLRAIGQDAKVSRLADQYMLIFIPGLLSFFLYVPLSKYVQNQNIVMPNLIIGLTANGVNALSHYLLIHVVKMNPGTVGSAVSQVLSYFTMLVLTLAYICVSRVYKETWHGWSTECLQDWGTFFKLAIFGLLMVSVEWWSFEIGVFLSGNLGMTDLGAQSVIFQMESIAYMLPLGMGIAASIRVGQHLGSGNPKKALTSSRVAITMICVTGLAVGLILVFLRGYLPRIFTNVSDVVGLAAKVLPILGLYMIFDSIAGVCAGVLRGSGRQKIGAITICSVYACAMAIGIPLMFLTKLGIAGFWWSLAVALAIESTIFLIVILSTSWDKQVDKAQERTNADDVFRRDIIESMATNLTSPLSGQQESAMTEGPVFSESDDLGTRDRTRLISEADDQPSSPVDSISSAALKRRRYTSQYSDFILPYIPEAESVPLRKLALPRLTAVFIVLAILGASLIIRFTVPIPGATLCVPTNTTVVNSTQSLPFCDDP